MRFLISNDDGVLAPGLLALYHALAKVGEVVVVAPESEQSGGASALNVIRPLYAQTLDSGFVAVNGTPADCVFLALHELYADLTFDCVITGINSGDNLGQKMMFSGTFGAAAVAQQLGVPAIAVSMMGGAKFGHDQQAEKHYRAAADEIKALITQTDVLDLLKNLPYHVLNVNIPETIHNQGINGRKITQLGHQKLANPVRQIIDPRGRAAYWLSLKKDQKAAPKHELSDALMYDHEAIAAGFVSLTPIRLYHAPDDALAALSKLCQNK